MRPGEEGAMDWLETIHLLNQNADLSKLDISIDMSIQRQLGDNSCIRVPYKKNLMTMHLSDRYELEMWTAYQQVIAPMIQLKGLKNLFVHLSWPRNDDLRDLQERELENTVMGEGYDSGKRGKPEQTVLWDPEWGITTHL